MSVTPDRHTGPMVAMAGTAGTVDGAGTVDPSGLRSAVEVIAAFVATFEPGCYSGADAAALVSLLSRGERLCGAGKTLAATRAAQAQCHRSQGHRSPAHWLAEVTGESLGDAIGTLAVGDALASQPGVEGAYRNGELSRPRARAVTEAAAVNPAEEEALLATATSDSLGRLREHCQRAKAQGRSRRDEAARYEALRRSRSVRTWCDPHDGAFRLEARLTPDAGAALAASLARETDAVAATARRAARTAPANTRPPVEGLQALRADALVNLVCGHGDGDQDQEPELDGTTLDGTTHEPDRARARGGSRRGATVHLRVDLEALRNGAVGQGQCCEIPGVGPVPIEQARRIMGEALTSVIVTNGVDVTTVCSLGRSIPSALMDALIERDPCCVVPGCDEAAHLEIDHLVPYAEGGPTSLANLARLCHWHHACKTHRGFVLTGSPGSWEWVPPPRSGQAGGATPPGDGGTPGGDVRGADDGPPEETEGTAPGTVVTPRPRGCGPGIDAGPEPPGPDRPGS